jgi:hypothetical protein
MKSMNTSHDKENWKERKSKSFCHILITIAKKKNEKLVIENFSTSVA